MASPVGGDMADVTSSGRRTAEDVLALCRDVRAMLDSLAAGEQNETFKKHKLATLESSVHAARDILNAIRSLHEKEEEHQDLYEKELAAADVVAAEQELQELEAEAQEKEMVWSTRELAIKRARTLALKERQLLEEERAKLLTTQASMMDAKEAEAAAESAALQKNIEAQRMALAAAEQQRIASHAQAALRLQMEALAEKQATLEAWSQLATLHSGAEQADATAATELAAALASAEHVVTSLEIETREAASRVVAAQAAADEARANIGAVQALAAATAQEVRLDEADKVRRATVDVHSEGLTAEQQRARVIADGKAHWAALVREREERQVPIKERRVALAARLAADAVQLSEGGRRVAQLRESAAASQMEAALQRQRGDAARAKREAHAAAASRAEEEGVSDAELRVRMQADAESVRRRGAESRVAAILVDAARAESLLTVQAAAWDAARTVRVVWLKAEAVARGSERTAMRAQLEAIERAERNEAGDAAALGAQMEVIKARAAAEVAALAAALEAELVATMALFREQKELGQLQAGDRVGDAQAAERIAAAEEVEARVAADAAEATRVQYVEAAASEELRVAAAASRSAAAVSAEEASINDALAAIEAAMDAKEAAAGAQARERAALLDATDAERHTLQAERLTAATTGAEAAVAACGRTWAAKIAALETEFTCGPLARLAAAQDALSASVARQDAAVALVNKQRAEYATAAAAAALSANTYAREKAKRAAEEATLEADVIARNAAHAQAGAAAEMAALEAASRAEDGGMRALEGLLVTQRGALAALAAHYSDEMAQFNAIAAARIARLDADEAAAVRAAERAAMDKSLSAEDRRVDAAKARAGSRAGLHKHRAQEKEDYEKKAVGMAIALDRVLERLFKADSALVLEQTDRLVAASVAARERDAVHTVMRDAKAAAAAAMMLAESAKTDALHERQVASKRKVMWQTAQARAQVALSAYQQMVSVTGTTKDDPEIVAAGEDYARALAIAADAQPPALMSEQLANAAELKAQQLGNAARLATQHSMLSQKKLAEAEEQVVALCAVAGITAIPVGVSDLPPPPVRTELKSGGVGSAAARTLRAAAPDARTESERLAEATRRALVSDFEADKARMLAEMAALDHQLEQARP